LSAMLGVDRRTLTNWRNQALKARAAVGRPRYSQSLKLSALIKVGRE